MKRNIFVEWIGIVISGFAITAQAQTEVPHIFSKEKCLAPSVKNSRVEVSCCDS